MGQRLKKSIIQILKVAFAIGLITWLVKSGHLDFKDLTQLLQLQYLLPGLTLVFLSLFLTSERWRCLLVAKKLPMESLKTFKLTLISIFFGYAMPGGVSGDIVKGYYIAKKNPHAKLTSLVTIGVDRLIGLYCMILMALTVMTLSHEYVQNSVELQLVYSALAVIFIGFSVGLTFVFSARVAEFFKVSAWLPRLPLGHRLFQLYQDLVSYREIKSVFVKAILLSLAAQTASISFFVLMGRGLGYDIPITIFFFVTPIGFIVTAIPISPAGVGVGQAAFYFLFNSVLREKSGLGPAVVTAYQIFTLFYVLIGALLYSLERGQLTQDTSAKA